VLGGSMFIGRRIVERLHERGDEVLVAHRGRTEPKDWVPVQHLHVARTDLEQYAAEIDAFAPEAVVDSYALTASDVHAVRDLLTGLPAVVLSSQDVYEAYSALTSGRGGVPVPYAEDAELRTERYPYRGKGFPNVPEDYEKLDVERLWLERGATVLRLARVYGPHDDQRREEFMLRRIRAGRVRIPVGPATLRWSKVHVDDVATAVLVALDTGSAAGQPVNIAESEAVPMRDWMRQIAAAAGAEVEFVQVPDAALPADLALTGAIAQDMYAAVDRARDLLGWSVSDPEQRVHDSVWWHLHHPPQSSWTDAETDADEAALAQASAD